MSVVTGPVETYQKSTELARLLEVYDQVNPTNVLEIGSMFGGTLYHFITRARKGARVCSIDLPVGFRDPRWSSMVAARLEWPKWATAAGVKLEVLMGDSRGKELLTWVKKAFPGGFDFVFIDGGHDYPTVKYDFMTYGLMVKPGGVIALHDIVGGKYPEYEVWRLWDDIQFKFIPDVLCGKVEEVIEDPKQGECGIGFIWRQPC